MAGVVRENARSCSATNAAETRMAWLPGALIAGIFPAVIFLRMDCALKFQRVATCATVKKSFIKYGDRCQSFCRILIHQNRPRWRLLFMLVNRL